jgi:hypothetical protein
MSLCPTFPGNVDEACPLQHVEMLRHGLPGQGLAAFRMRERAYLKQGLFTLPVQKFENPASFKMRQRLEDEVDSGIIHIANYAVTLLHVNHIGRYGLKV